LHLDDYLRLICFLSTSVYSALGVSAIMRYINRRFTYLLTYSLTNTFHKSIRCELFISQGLTNYQDFSKFIT